MKKFVLAGIAACFLLSSGQEGNASPRANVKNRIEIQPSSAGTVDAGSVDFRFQLLDTDTNTSVASADLSITHEQKLHIFLFDPALKEFRHAHPEFDGDSWSVNLRLDANGDYWVWAQGTLASDRFEFTASARLSVVNGEAGWPVPTELGDVRVGTVESSVATLSPRRLVAGRSAMLSVTFSRNDGTEPEIAPYLGAFAHMVVVPTAGDELLHVHPMNGPNPNEGIIHTTYPEAGDYRIWIQFLDGGNLRVIPLSVTVHSP